MVIVSGKNRRNKGLAFVGVLGEMETNRTNINHEVSMAEVLSPYAKCKEPMVSRLSSAPCTRGT